MTDFSVNHSNRFVMINSSISLQAAWWKPFIRPAKNLHNDNDRERARLLASMTLGAILFHVLVIAVLTVSEDLASLVIPVILSLIAVSAIYGLSRSQYYQLGVNASIGLSMIWAFGLIIANHDQHFIIITLLPVFIISIFYKAQIVMLGGALVLISSTILLTMSVRAFDAEIHILLMTVMIVMLAVISALRQYNRALRDEQILKLANSELRFRTIFEASLSSFFLLESVRNPQNEIEDFVFVDVNQKGLEILKQTREQVVGQRLLTISPSSDSVGFFEKYKQVVRTGVGYEEDFFVEPSIPTTGWYSHQVVKINDGIAISTVDITSRREKEITANQILLEQQRTEMLQEIVSEFSHDLLTPITILKTSLYLLTRDPNEDLRANRISKLNTQLTKLEKMIRDMLTLSRLESPNTQHFAFELYSLNDMLNPIVEDYQQIAAERQQNVLLQAEPDLPLVPLDINTMPRALGNLIDNALKYTDKGGTVTVSTELRDHQAVIKIRDTGKGIEAEYLSHIFDRYYRMDEHRKSTSGTGLGLAIVKKVIEGHGGTIEVASTVDVGTTFIIALPIATASDA